MQLPRAWRDVTWTEGAGPVPLQIALVTFGILVLELSLIRWIAGQIRLFAYFNNLVLMAAFLGMGLGVRLGRSWPGLIHGALPMLAGLSAILANAEALGLQRMHFPDRAVSLWGADSGFAVLAFAIILGLFWAITTLFMMTAAPLGLLFERLPALRAYGWDLLGSLCGIVALTAVTVMGSPPPVWLGLACLPLLWLSRRWCSFLAAVVVIIFAWLSIEGAIFSPYNRIDVEPSGHDYIISVNRDFHQHILDMGARHLADPALTPEARNSRLYLRAVYDIPFLVSPKTGSAAIVGAGTGNDVQAAVRNGFGPIDSVDIDGVIVSLGKRLHPEHPYAAPQVVPVIDDARAFFGRYEGPPLQVVDYGLLDSHAMFSSMSTLRLDNYVYTEQGLRAAWRHVAPQGLLSVSFSVFAGDWISDRLYWTIYRATGVQPAVVDHHMNFGRSFIVSRDMAALHLDRVSWMGMAPSPRASLDQTWTTSDDWPFIYIRPGVFPLGYVAMLVLVLLSSAVATRAVFGAHSFDGPMFCMGAAFLLIETRGITEMSLLYGSTWIINTCVFVGVILMALVSNWLVMRLAPRQLAPWFGLLFASLIALYAVDPDTFNHFSVWSRGLAGGLFNALPIGFAGVIVSCLLARSSRPAAALGSNLLGAVVGGCLEYTSMWLGLKALVLVAMGLYAAAALWQRQVSGAQAGEALRSQPAGQARQDCVETSSKI
jgi:hypothetical protein